MTDISTIAAQLTEAQRRNDLIADRIEQRLEAILQMVPPTKPGAQYWLDSDAGPSYCRDCVIIARGWEYELGPLIGPSPSYCRDDWEDDYYDGIDGGRDIESDSTACCDICGKTLSYILTDYGVEQECNYYREAPLAMVRDEDSYALDRLALNIWAGSPRHLILGVAVAVNQAYRLALKAHLEAQR